MKHAESDRWSIEFGEKPLRVGVLDNILLAGRDMSHSFIRLRSGQGNVISELHGFGYDSINNKIIPFSFSPLKHLRFMFSNVCGHTYRPDFLRVLAFNYEKTRGETVKITTLFEGHEEEVLHKWILAQSAAAEINRKGFDYNFLTIPGLMNVQNCHSVSTVLIDAMGLEVPKGAYVTPGLGAKLDGLSLPFTRVTMDTFRRSSLDYLKGKMEGLNEVINRNFVQVRRSLSNSHESSCLALSSD